jgi:hypothetical protein
MLCGRCVATFNQIGVKCQKGLEVSSFILNYAPNNRTLPTYFWSSGTTFEAINTTIRSSNKPTKPT